MKINLASKVARRYLFSKKSHSAVNIISIVSICGVAIATMAIICVLSVFNGFQDVIAGKLNQLSPDIRITASKGKVINNADSIIFKLQSVDGILVAMPEIRDNALATFDNRQMPITLLGVDQAMFDSITTIRRLIKSDGIYALRNDADVTATVSFETSQAEADAVAAEEFDEASLFVNAEDLYAEEIEVADSPEYFALLSVGTAIRLAAHPGMNTALHLFTPCRLGTVNLGNPASAFMTDSLFVSGVFQTEQMEYDSDLVIIDIELARRLFQYTVEASAIDVRVDENVDASQLARTLQAQLGNEYVVKDRLQQQEINYRMVSIEKWITFLLLTFILLIASFNIISTLSMLIIEKHESIDTLHCLGATRRMIGNIFRWETLYVNIIGAIGGILVGLILCLLQEHFGLIRLNGDEANLIITAYPVKIIFTDLLIVLIPIAVIGLISAEISARFAVSRLNLRQE